MDTNAAANAAEADRLERIAALVEARLAFQVRIVALTRPGNRRDEALRLSNEAMVSAQMAVAEERTLPPRWMSPN